jgi:2-polyprenyl-3-methyl-5-hydroxy-6-metoxy-1,4-benzoquinol methylase
MINVRNGKQFALWHCSSCDYEFFAHDPSHALAANKLDESRLKAAGLDIPTLERDFANGIEQSRPYLAEYIDDSDRGANVLEIGCSWGYFLKLARDAGAKPFGVEVNAIRAQYVNDQLVIPCDTSLDACEARGIKFRKIFLFYVLEYVPSPVAYMQRLMSLLEPNGKLIVITPNLNDSLKDLWRNEGFRRFFYDEYAINYMTPRTVEVMLARLSKRDSIVTTRQGYSFVNHISWFLTQAPRTTGVVGGDNFVRAIDALLRPDEADATKSDTARQVLAGDLAGLIERFDVEYRRILERGRYGNQIRFMVTK